MKNIRSFYNYMKRILISCLFAWFLIIQGFRVESAAVAVIPMQDESYCNAAITKLKIYTFRDTIKYTCVDAGKV